MSIKNEAFNHPDRTVYRVLLPEVGSSHIAPNTPTVKGLVLFTHHIGDVTSHE